jgi:hypothetical protein
MHDALYKLYSVFPCLVPLKYIFCPILGIEVGDSILEQAPRLSLKVIPKFSA